MDLVGLFQLVGGLFFDSSDARDPIAYPLYVTQALCFCLDDGFHLALCVQDG